MIRVLTILATVAALAVSVSAAPASASGTGVGRVGGKMHLDDISMGVVTDQKEGWWQRSR